MHREKRKIMRVLLPVLLLLLSTVGLTYAWFAQHASMTTLLSIQPPDAITIIPTTTDGSELTELDLDFHENSQDTKAEDGTIHIYRPVCIKSTEPIHRLEIVHTTNLQDLGFKIYPATKNGSSEIEKSASALSGAYKNKNVSTGLAKEEVLENYKTTGDVADTHAYPLYWIAVNCATQEKWQSGWQEVTSYIEKGIDPKTNKEIDYYCTYYVLEISWKENTKETDLFYIMAQNVAE